MSDQDSRFNSAQDVQYPPLVSPHRVLEDIQVQGHINIYAAQLNTRVGDIQSNVQKILENWTKADLQNADLLVTPELSITGYPLEDLVENPDLLEAAQSALDLLIEASKHHNAAILVGLPMKGAQDQYGRDIYNSAVLIENGKILQKIRKQHLPNHDVFDEVRNFAKGSPHDPVEFRGCKLGIMICEDTWHKDVSSYLAQEGAQVLISMNASPYESGKLEQRIENIVRERVVETGLPLLYVNQVGGQDEIVFDGASFAMNANLLPIYQDKHFESSGQMLKLRYPREGHAAFDISRRETIPCHNERDYCALVTGLRDYMTKTNHKKVVLGMSGGLDSALVAAIATDAIGGENVHLISLPSRFTANISNEDAYIAANLMGAHIKQAPIEDALQSLRATFDEASYGVADENIQARLRGTIIMWHANMHGHLPLSTGNKSEISVGYCTLYGDMNGGFNPLKDVWKTRAYELAKWRNAHKPAGVLGPEGPIMPERIYTRPPSAELAEGQEDSQSLPPYERLDPILKAYIEHHAALKDIAAQSGEDEKLVADIINKVDKSEFKRRQACPGVKISPRSFGRGRRYPIARPDTGRMLRRVNRMKLR